MNTRTVVLFVMAGLFIAGVAAAISEDLRESVGAQWRRVNSDPGQACLDYQSKDLKDPYSARFVSYTVDSGSSSSVKIKYRAKNSYGAYEVGEAMCVVRSGEVDISSTESARAFEASMAESNAQLEKIYRRNKCLENQLAELYAGRKPKTNCENID